MLETTVLNCCAEAYCVDVQSITPATDIREDLSNQSLKLLAFISGIEEELDVTIDMNDAGKLITIADFIEKVRELS